MGVHVDLKLREKIRHTLDFVQDGAAREPRKKATRIPLRVLALLKRLERNEGLLRERRLAERALAGLPRSGDNDDWVILGSGSQRMSQGSCEKLGHADYLEVGLP